MKKIDVKNLNLWYGKFQALKNVTFGISDKKITAIIGPSGCGKSSLLRIFNRMNDLVEGSKMAGDVIIDGSNIIDPEADLVALRKKIIQFKLTEDAP